MTDFKMETIRDPSNGPVIAIAVLVFVVTAIVLLGELVS
jgi:hypothetical protein